MQTQFSQACSMTEDGAFEPSTAVVFHHSPAVQIVYIYIQPSFHSIESEQVNGPELELTLKIKAA